MGEGSRGTESLRGAPQGRRECSPMSAESEMRDRVLRLEIEMKHMSNAVLAMKGSQDDTNAKVTELRDAVLMGKGAAWAGRLIWLGAVGLLTALGMKFTGLLSWLAGR